MGKRDTSARLDGGGMRSAGPAGTAFRSAWGSVSTVGPYDLRPGPYAGRRATVSPVRGNVSSDEREA